MHGLIFAGLRDYSVLRLGEDEAEKLWEDVHFETTEAYEDERFGAQLQRLVAATGDTPDELLRGFGSYAATTTFAGLFPGYYAESPDAFAFLLGIEEKIHDLVRATIPDATPPRLHVHELRGLGVLVSYTSDRKLCRLLEGLVRGTAEYYGDEVVLEEIQCMHRGDPGCVFTVLRSAA